MMMKVRGINFTEDELKDLTHAIDKEQKDSIKEGFGFLAKHQDAMKGLGDMKL